MVGVEDIVFMPHLLGGGGVLGDGLCALGHGVLGKLTRQDQADALKQSVKWLRTRVIENDSRCLDFPRRDGGLLVVCGELGCLTGDALEDVVDEGVQDGHGTVGDTGVWVDLLED